MSFFQKKFALFAKNRKIHFQRLLAPDNTLLLRYRWAKSVERWKSWARSKNIFSKILNFFEISLFWWRHNAISKNFWHPSRTHLRDSIDTLFVQIGQEMRKWQPKSYKKRENRKSLAPLFGALGCHFLISCSILTNKLSMD